MESLIVDKFPFPLNCKQILDEIRPSTRSLRLYGVRKSRSKDVYSLTHFSNSLNGLQHLNNSPVDLQGEDQREKGFGGYVTLNFPIRYFLGFSLKMRDKVRLTMKIRFCERDRR